MPLLQGERVHTTNQEARRRLASALPEPAANGGRGPLRRSSRRPSFLRRGAGEGLRGGEALHDLRIARTVARVRATATECGRTPSAAGRASPESTASAASGRAGCYAAAIDLFAHASRPAPRDVLRDVFGYTDFRPGQERLIAAVLAGRDCIGVMPTGAGKSLTYQIPARILPGTALVVSPLISLMKDQVDALTRAGFRATVLNSTLDPATRRDRLARLRRGEYELVYVAPEGLEGGLRHTLAGLRVTLVAVDEAHCISEWGHDFRPAYRRLCGLKQQLGGPPVLALTATATRPVVRDIMRQLGMVKPDGFKGAFFRPNLRLTVHKKGDGRGSRKDLVAFARARRGESGIVYTLSRRNVESLARSLCDAGIRAVPYHAGLEDAVRARHQEAFARDRVDVVVATVAFGMGIDKSNVRWVLHRELPRSIESWYQEIGRAGRDGLASDCVLLYSWADVVSHRALQERIEDAAARAAARRSSGAAFALADAAGCRWQNLVRHFDESIDPCGTSCDACRGETLLDLVRPEPAAARHSAAPDGELFAQLRAVRRALADAEGVPAYVVFSDAVLARMATARPADEQALLAISGVGPTKLARYGDAFLRVLRQR
jgi:ATP-dependent DNA helicase RecQ